MNKEELKEYHRNYQKNYQRQYLKKKRDERKAKGLCRHCGKNKPLEGKAGCQVCLEKIRKANLKRINERKNNGLCIKCGLPNSNGKTLCYECAETNSSQVKISKIKNNKFKGWIESWFCLPPDTVDEVIVTDSDGSVYSLELDRGASWNEMITDTIIAWRYLPEPFKEECDGNLFADTKRKIH